MSTDTSAAQAEAQAAQGGCCGSDPSGCSTHGAADQQQQPLQQLEAPSPYATDPSATDAPVRLTEKAAVEVKRFIAEKNVPDEAVLRIVVRAGGCSGFEHTLGFDTNTSDSDVVTSQYGIPVVMDSKFVPFMQGTVVDYLDGIDKRGFKFDNPNATGSCGCGSSFSV